MARRERRNVILVVQGPVGSEVGEMMNGIATAVFWVALVLLSVKLLNNVMLPYFMLVSKKHSDPIVRRGESPMLLMDWLLYGLLSWAGCLLPTVPIGISSNRLAGLGALAIVATYAHFLVVAMVGVPIRNMLRRRRRAQ